MLKLKMGVKFKVKVKDGDKDIDDNKLMSYCIDDDKLLK